MSAREDYLELAGTVRRIRALHHPVSLYLAEPDSDYSFEDREEAVEFIIDLLDDEREHDEQARAAAIAGITSFEVCAHCKDIEREQAAERGYEHAAWPCRTALCWLDPAKIDRPTEETP